MSNLRYIAPIYDRLGGSSALPVAFSMYAVGGRTQGIGVIASWWTTQGAQSQIDWAITEGFTPPSPEDFQTTSWTQDFVRDHEIPFPQVFMGRFHWFYARSRNASGEVLSSPRRGIYAVPNELDIPLTFYITAEKESYTDILSEHTHIYQFSSNVSVYTPIASIGFGFTTAAVQHQETIETFQLTHLKAEAKLDEG